MIKILLVPACLDRQSDEWVVAIPDWSWNVEGWIADAEDMLARQGNRWTTHSASIDAFLVFWPTPVRDTCFVDMDEVAFWKNVDFHTPVRSIEAHLTPCTRSISFESFLTVGDSVLTPEQDLGWLRELMGK